MHLYSMFMWASMGAGVSHPSHEFYHPWFKPEMATNRLHIARSEVRDGGLLVRVVRYRSVRLNCVVSFISSTFQKEWLQNGLKSRARMQKYKAEHIFATYHSASN